MMHGPTPPEVSPVRFAHRPWERRILGFARPDPSLSWRVTAAPTGWEQTRSEVEISISDGNRSVHPIDGGEQTFLPWPGDPLASGQAADVRVRVAGRDGAWSAWSTPSTVECGLLDTADWKGACITPSTALDRQQPAPVLTRHFVVEDTARQARLHITAGGLFVAFIDGRRIGEDQLTPGWTDYHTRINALTYDITEELTPGPHNLCVILGNGWYRGHLTWQYKTDVYGDRLWLLANLNWTDDHGNRSLATDHNWSWHPSPILANDLYDGERRDMRVGLLERNSDPRPVMELDIPDTIVPQEAPTARIISRIPAHRIINSPSGKLIVDFGQNLAGWVSLTVHGGKRGTEVCLHHAEVLQGEELALEPLRQAKASDTYILSGESEEVLEPMFTQHGFRYVQVEGVNDLRTEDIEACQISATMEPTASFRSSDSELDRLFQNVRWSTMDNFITIPTDCPQRDERLGWTGDIAVFAPTALELFDAGAFLESWLTDMATSQAPDGGIPLVIPDVLDGPKLTCGWGDATVLVPWALYQMTGDTAALKRFLPMMDKFVEGVEATSSKGLWKGGFQFGDWLDPDAPDDDPFGSKADPDVVATAFAAHSARLVASAHETLGESGKRYQELADGVAQAFRDEYVSPNGAILSDCPTVYSLALAWDLLKDDRQRKGAGRRLADLVRGSGFRISTGFLGTPVICRALTMSGNAELAMRLLEQRRCPSWLYPVTMGATTTWERWDSILPNGSINPDGMTSFNHYAVGAVASWMMEDLAGLHMLSPGWTRVRIAPLITVGPSLVDFTQTTPYGPIHIRRQRAQSRTTIELSLPVGVEAEVELPDTPHCHCGHGEHRWILDQDGGAQDRTPQIKTIRDLIDSERLMDDLCRTIDQAGSPAYQGPDADLAFCKNARAWLDADISSLAAVVTQQGFVPASTELEKAVNDFMSRHGLCPVPAGKDGHTNE